MEMSLAKRRIQFQCPVIRFIGFREVIEIEQGPTFLIIGKGIMGDLMDGAVKILN